VLRCAGLGRPQSCHRAMHCDGGFCTEEEILDERIVSSMSRSGIPSRKEADTSGKAAAAKKLSVQ
jgi:hypothetical protein